MAPSPWSPHVAWEEVGALGGLGLAYAAGVRRAGATRARLGAFALRLALALPAVASPIATVALHYLLSAHLLQNVMLAEWAPALLVLGVPPALAAHVGRPGPVRALTHPFVALPCWLLGYAVWHVPFLYQAALHHRLILDAEHLTYLIAGLVLWWPVFQSAPRDLSSGARAAYLFAAFFFASPLGLLLALLPD